MADENYEARNEMWPTDDGSHFFAHLEILGLKNAKRQGVYDSLKEKVECFVETSKAEIRMATLKDECGFSIGSLADSDSIYVWTQYDYRLCHFDDLLQIVKSLLVSGFKQGLPLRGVVSYGNFKVKHSGKTDEDQDNSSVDNEELHRIVHDAAQDLGSPMNWSGVVLTQKAWEEVSSEFAKGKDEEWGRTMRPPTIDSVEWLLGRYLLPCDVPFEDGGSRRYNAINWNYNPNDGLSEDVIRKAFEGPCAVFDEDVRTKLGNTLNFLDYTLNVAKSRRTSQNASSAVVDSDLLITDKTREETSFRGGDDLATTSRQGCASDPGNRPRELADFLNIKTKGNG